MIGKRSAKRSLIKNEGEHECNSVAASYRWNFGVVRRRMEHKGLHETRTLSGQAISRFADFDYLTISKSRT